MFYVFFFTNSLLFTSQLSCFDILRISFSLSLWRCMYVYVYVLYYVCMCVYMYVCIGICSPWYVYLCLSVPVVMDIPLDYILSRHSSSNCCVTLAAAR